MTDTNNEIENNNFYVYGDNDVNFNFEFSKYLQGNTPIEFGCSRAICVHFFADTDCIQDIEKGIQKYKDILLKLNFDPTEIDGADLQDMSPKDLEEEYHFDSETAKIIWEYVQPYLFGVFLLGNVESEGHFTFEYQVIERD